MKHAILALALVIVSWQLLPSIGLLNPRSIPAFLSVVSAIPGLVLKNNLAFHAAVTASRALIAFCIGAAASLLAAFLIANFKLWRHMIEPYLFILFSMPPVVFFPWLVMFFGVGELPGIFIAVIACMLPMTAMNFVGLKGVSKVHIKVARMSGCSRIDGIIKVGFPSALPSMMSGAEAGIIVSLLFIVVAEMISSSVGLGHMVSSLQYYWVAGPLFAVISVIGCLGLLFSFIIKMVKKRVLGWV